MSLKYKIKYNYDTGDSFNSYKDQEEELDFAWNNLDIAKQNLKRIKEHYHFYEASHGSTYGEYLENLKRYETKQETEKRIKKILENAKTKDWFVSKYDFCLKLQADNGQWAQISAPWCGYFEKLNYVEIVSCADPDLKIEFR